MGPFQKYVTLKSAPPAAGSTPGGNLLATATGNAYAQDEPLTHRRGWWWAVPLATFLVYTAFVIYGVFRFMEPVLDLYRATGSFALPADANAYFDRYFVADNGNYHYLAPFGTPDLTFLVPSFLYVHPFVTALLRNPAFVILPFPALFRFTCYYYRKSYYRAFTARPYACAVPAAKGFGYRGERGLLVLQNLHRYFLYAAIVITFFLAYDAVRSIVTPHGLYFGLGSAMMLLNIAFIVAYTFGCHSFRHLVGGKLDCYSCDAPSTTRYKWWTRVTMLNNRHALWAWLSMLSVAAVDLYIRWLALNPRTHLFGVIPV